MICSSGKDFMRLSCMYWWSVSIELNPVKMAMPEMKKVEIFMVAMKTNQQVQTLGAKPLLLAEVYESSATGPVSKIRNWG